MRINQGHDVYVRGTPGYVLFMSVGFIGGLIVGEVLTQRRVGRNRAAPSNARGIRAGVANLMSLVTPGRRNMFAADLQSDRLRPFEEQYATGQLIIKVTRIFDAAANAADNNGEGRKAKEIRDDAARIIEALQTLSIREASLAAQDLQKIGEDLSATAEDLPNETARLKDWDAFLSVWAKLLKFLGLEKQGE